MLKVFKIFFLVLSGALVISFISYIILTPKFQKTQTATEPFFTDEKEILNNLTLEQKIGQLFLIGFEGANLTPQLENLIKTIHPGGVLLLSRNIEDKNQLKKLIMDIQEISLKESGLLLFVAVDQEGGVMSRISWLSEKTPQPSIRNTDEAYKIGFKRGKELKELGINLNLAPVVDITGPDDFLHNRSFQKGSQITGELAALLVSGQRNSGIFTAIKHFPGYGGISFNPERTKLPILSKIPETSHFLRTIQSAPEMIMTANVVYSEIDKELPFTLSPKGIQFLKDNLRQDLLVISDDLSSPVLKKEFSLAKTITLAVKSGINILIVAGFDEPKDSLYAFNSLLEAVKTGDIAEERINHSALKIIRLKQNLLR